MPESSSVEAEIARLHTFLNQFREGPSSTGDDLTRPKGKPWSVAELASHLGCTTKHVRYLLDSGRLESIRVGKRRRMIADHIVRKLEQQGI